MNKKPSRKVKLLTLTGAILLVAGILLFNTFRFGPLSTFSDQAVTIGSSAGIALIAIGGFLFYRGRQHSNKELAEEIITGSKPYVLYLRPFKADTPFSTYSISMFYWGNILTKEEQLFKSLKPFGDLLAIGKPGEALPTPGAARIYTVSDWKKTVSEKIKDAKLVIIHADTTDSLMWELGEAVKMPDPKKLLLLILDMKKKSYKIFRDDIQQKFKISLPELRTLKSFAFVQVAPGFICFSNDWQSSFLPLQAPFIRKSPYQPYISRFTYALKPVFENFSIKWQTPRVSGLVIIGISALVLLVLIFALLIIFAN